MVDEMIVESLKLSIGEIIIFYVGGYRFEGKVLEVGSEFLKYFDSHKSKERFVRLSDMQEVELK